MSDSDRPRCQNRIVSSGDSRPGLAPTTISHSSACRFSRVSLPASTCWRSAPNWPRRALAPVVDDDLRHDVGQRQLHRAHRAVGNDQRPRRDPARLEQRRRRAQPRRLDDDVGSLDAAAPVRRSRRTALPRSVRQPARERVAALAAGASARGSRRSRTAGRAAARSSRPCRARRCGRGPVRRARARCRAPIAVTAPVRISVIAVASTTARGIPVAGSNRLSSAISDGSPRR